MKKILLVYLLSLATLVAEEKTLPLKLEAPPSPSYFDLDLTGGIVSSSLVNGQGNLGARATLWGNTFFKDQSQIGAFVLGEASSYDQKTFVDIATVGVAYRLQNFGKIVPELRLSGGYDFEQESKLGEVTVGGRYNFTKHFSAGADVGPRLYFYSEGIKWKALVRAFVGFSF